MAVLTWLKLALSTLLLNGTLGTNIGRDGCGGQAKDGCDVAGDSVGLMQIRNAPAPAQSPTVEQADDMISEIEQIWPTDVSGLWPSVKEMLKHFGGWLDKCLDPETTKNFTSAVGHFLATCGFTSWAEEQMQAELDSWGGQVATIPHHPADNFSKPTATVAWLYATATTCDIDKLKQWPNGFDNQQCKYFGMDGEKVEAIPFQDHQWGLFPEYIEKISDILAKWMKKCTGFDTKAGWELLVTAATWWLRDLLQGNKKGFVAVDHTLGAVVASVSGTGVPGDPGFLDDVIADANFWWDIAGQKTAVCEVRGVTLPGYYHPGFCAYYNKMVRYSDYEENLIATAKANPELDLMFTGHSLGGATITIAAIDAHYRLKLQPKRWLLYTFGSPRAGSPASANYVNTNFDTAYRITRMYDPVPLMVPCYPVGGVKAVGLAPTSPVACVPVELGPYHYGTEVYFPYNAFYPQATVPAVALRKGFPPEYKTCDGSGEDSQCSAQVALKEFTCNKITHTIWPTKLAVGFGMIHVDYMNNGLAEWCCSAA